MLAGERIAAAADGGNEEMEDIADAATSAVRDDASLKFVRTCLTFVRGPEVDFPLSAFEAAFVIRRDAGDRRAGRRTALAALLSLAPFLATCAVASTSTLSFRTFSNVAIASHNAALFDTSTPSISDGNSCDSLLINMIV